MLNITAHGNLGNDPSVKEINDTQVAQFTLAARTGKDETTWISCFVWGKRADVVKQYMHKGDTIAVAGSGKVNTYTKRDGTEVRTLDLRVTDFTLPASKETTKNKATADSGDIPF
jgi:single-strand DNA-binding protein